MEQKQHTSLRYLFWVFLKIGAISWGGFMALISVVQKQLVEKDKKIADEVILDGVSLASVLPGPIAFNVVAYLGFVLRGIKGALVSMIAILLPSFLLILLLSYFYFAYQEIPAFANFFKGVLPAVAAIIISVAINMTKKNVGDYKQVIILVLAGVVLIFSHSYFATILIMAAGAVAGWLLYRKSVSESASSPVISEKINRKMLLLAAACLAILLVFVLVFPYLNFGEKWQKVEATREIGLTFSGMSLTLFGGGYVVIPAMHKVVVEGLNWLSTREFSDAIAMGQITPGPIFISATFIGYKVAGLVGAIVATLAIFFPPATLMIFLSHFMIRIKNSKAIVAIFKGLRPAVIGMIFAAAFTIGKSVEMTWPSPLIFLVVLLAAIRFKVNVALLIPLSGLAGTMLFLI